MKEIYTTYEEFEGEASVDSAAGIVWAVDITEGRVAFALNNGILWTALSKEPFTAEEASAAVAKNCKEFVEESDGTVKAPEPKDWYMKANEMLQSGEESLYDWMVRRHREG